MKIYFLGLFVFLSTLLTAQTNYNNRIFGYSFEMPEGWSVKDEQTSFDNDLKLVNGKGSSIVVNVDKLTSDVVNKTAEDVYEQFSDAKLLEMYRSMIPNIKLVNRGMVNYSGIDFYYINLEIPKGTAPHLLSKIFVVHKKGRRYVFTFNCLYELEGVNLIKFHTLLNSLKI
jgi:hypothetical protein